MQRVWSGKRRVAMLRRHRNPRWQLASAALGNHCSAPQGTPSLRRRPRTMRVDGVETGRLRCDQAGPPCGLATGRCRRYPSGWTPPRRTEAPGQPCLRNFVLANKDLAPSSRLSFNMTKRNRRRSPRSRAELRWRQRHRSSNDGRKGRIRFRLPGLRRPKSQRSFRSA